MIGILLMLAALGGFIVGMIVCYLMVYGPTINPPGSREGE